MNKNLVGVVTGCLLVTGCWKAEVRQNSEKVLPVVSSQNELWQFVGREIIVRGTQTNTKFPTVLGICISANDELNGQIVELSGRLEFCEIVLEDTPDLETTSDLDLPVAVIGPAAPNRRYMLVDPSTNEEVVIPKLAKFFHF